MQTDAVSLERITSLVEHLENEIHSSLRTHTVVINDLGMSNMTLSKPVWITVERHAIDDFVACFYDADIYGYGDCIPTSLEDLKRHIVSQYIFLAEHRHKTQFGPSPSKQLEVLSRLIVGGKY